MVPIPLLQRTANIGTILLFAGSIKKPVTDCLAIDYPMNTRTLISGRHYPVGKHLQSY